MFPYDGISGGVLKTTGRCAIGEMCKVGMGSGSDWAIISSPDGDWFALISFSSCLAV